LEGLVERHPGVASNARGRGLLAAFDLPDKAKRKHVLDACFEHGMMVLGSGERSLRFRPALVINEAEVDEAIAILDDVLGGAA
jgi:L-lysine 6-transaminase